MEVPKIKKDESLAMWRERLAEEYHLSDMVQEILRVVSIESYIHGTKDILKALREEGRIELIDN